LTAILIDSDVLFDVGRGHPAALAWVAAHPSDRVALAGYTAMEAIQGCRDKRELDRSTKLYSPYVILWPDEDACRRALALFARFHLNHSLGLIDALVAATALQFGLPLHTFNQKHFGAIPGLTIVAPYVR